MVKKDENSFVELSNGQISEARFVVISRFNKGGYTLAQQMRAKEGTKTISSFMKGAIQIDSLEGLHNLRDAINAAISIEEKRKKEDKEIEWDDED